MHHFFLQLVCNPRDHLEIRIFHLKGWVSQGGWNILSSQAQSIYHIFTHPLGSHCSGMDTRIEDVQDSVWIFLTPFVHVGYKFTQRTSDCFCHTKIRSL